ncbi:uncharacterized protein METZ01_LOCUS362546 [marine metagenome]|uniref:Uncharacterized protein n=1 Tax=marine metagenome TaxID=408172 RepID=A0A382SJF1_9ZZZZ
MTDDSPDWESVKKRFAKANEVLEQAGERLRSLVLADETQSEYARSISEASQQLSSFVQETSTATTVAGEAVTQAAESLLKAEEFYEGLLKQQKIVEKWIKICCLLVVAVGLLLAFVIG